MQCNAISYLDEPIFLDVDEDTLGLSPNAVSEWLKMSFIDSESCCIHKESSRKIKAYSNPSFGHPSKIDELSLVANEWNLCLLEDAAESMGSFFNKRHVGTFGNLGILSFNGNKLITTEEEELFMSRFII